MSTERERTPVALLVNPTGIVSGAERVLVRVAGWLTNAGWKVVAAVPGGPLADELAALGATIVRIPDLKLGTGSRPVAAARLVMANLYTLLRLSVLSRRGSLVVANALQALPPLRGVACRHPVVYVAHDVVQRDDRRRLLRWVAPSVTRALAVSEAVAATLRPLGIPAAVVRNGTEPSTDRARREADPPVIGCCALLARWKGQDILLDAVARLERDDVLVELLGGCLEKDTPFARRLEARASQDDLTGRVTFVGHDPEPMARMRGWTVAVSASVDPEAAPLNVLEAMSLGLPVVGTNHGGTPEVLDGAGLLVPPGDVGALAGAIQRLLDDPELAARCAAGGPAEIKASLTLEHQRRAFLVFVDEVLRRWGAR